MVCLISAYFLTYKGKYDTDEIYRGMNSSVRHWQSCQEQDRLYIY